MLPVLTQDAQQTLEVILSWFPPVVRASRKEKLLRMTAALMAERGVREADKTLIIEAGKFISRPSLRIRFDILSGATVRQREVVKAPYQEIGAYYAAPRRVKRWEPVLVPPPKPVDQMKVLAFSGSSRIGGNSDSLVDEALRGASSAGAKVEKIHLTNLKLARCTNVLIQRDYHNAVKVVKPLKLPYCEYGRGFGDGTKGQCDLQDGIQEIYAKIQAADAIIIGFPIINGWEGDEVTVFLERWARYHECVGTPVKPERRSMVIGTWGTLDVDTYEHIIENIASKIGMRGFPTIEAVAATGFVGLLSGLDEEGKGIVLRYPEILKEAFQAGRSLVTGKLD